MTDGIRAQGPASDADAVCSDCAHAASEHWRDRMGALGYCMVKACACPEYGLATTSALFSGKAERF